MITMYLAQARSALLQQFQYRAANYFYMIGMIAEPVVYLVVWSTIARAHGGSIDGLTPGGFAAYYIVWTLVRNMNIVLTPFAWEERIKDGTFSGQLMKPVHPIHEDLAQFMGWKIVVLLFRPTLSPSLLQCVVFFFAIWLAFLIRAIMQWSLGLITFWTTRVSAIFEAYYLTELLLSGRVFPLVLMPKWFQTVTWFFPFRWSFYFPIVALTGPIEDRDLFIGLGMQMGWIAFSIGLLYVVWPRAVRHFSSVGG